MSFSAQASHVPTSEASASSSSSRFYYPSSTPILPYCRPAKNYVATNAHASSTQPNTDSYLSNYSVQPVCHTCKICSYQTPRKSDIQKHVRIHTNDKPFSCNLCTYKSNFKNDVLRHVKSRHSTEVSATLSTSNSDINYE